MAQIKRLRKVSIKDIEVLVLEGERIKNKDKKEGLYYYECRHSDFDWSEPATIEDSVIINFWGNVISKVSLDKLSNIEDIVYISLSDNESEILSGISDKKCEYVTVEEYLKSGV